MRAIKKLQRLYPMRQRPKVFCIGYNKTGTTTLETVLNNLGYRTPNQQEQEALVVEETFRGNFKPLESLCKTSDAFQDMPFSQGATYAVADTLFPGSKFILTVRESGEWFESLARFHLNGILKKAGVERLGDFGEMTFKNKAIYLKNNYLQNIFKRHAFKSVGHEAHYDWSLVYNRDHRISAYERRNRAIVEHFQERPGDLLVLDLTKEVDSSKIVEFLGLPSELNETLPHLNRSR